MTHGLPNNKSLPHNYYYLDKTRPPSNPPQNLQFGRREGFLFPLRNNYIHGFVEARKTIHFGSTLPHNMSTAQANDAEKNIEIWKVKKLIKRLEAARGNGTSMISLIIRT